MIINCLTDENIDVPYDQLKGAILENLNLHRAMLEEKDLSSSSLKGTNLRGAFLYKANLTNCNLSLTNLIVADFRKTILSLQGLDYD